MQKTTHCSRSRKVLIGQKSVPGFFSLSPQSANDHALLRRVQQSFDKGENKRYRNYGDLWNMRMKNQLLVRSLLVDPITKKYIKAVNEQDFSDFVQLLTKQNQDSKLEVFDFSLVIEAFHGHLDERLKYREDTEVCVKRNNVFNGWKRIRSIRNEGLLNSAVVNNCAEAEDALNWIHTRLPKLKSDFSYAPDYDYRTGKNEKAAALISFSGEIEAFIEVLLCSIHSMLLVDHGYFRGEDVYIGHCCTVRGHLIEVLCKELGYRNGNFDWNSAIHQCVMEPERVGIDANALLLQIGSAKHIEDIRRTLVNAESVEEFGNGTRGYVVKWPSTPSYIIEGIKNISRLLLEIDSISDFLRKLNSSDFQYGAKGGEQNTFEKEVRILLSKR